MSLPYWCVREAYIEGEEAGMEAQRKGETEEEWAAGRRAGQREEGREDGRTEGREAAMAVASYPLHHTRSLEQGTYNPDTRTTL
jgi:hypothetical protein